MVTSSDEARGASHCSESEAGARACTCRVHVVQQLGCEAHLELRFHDEVVLFECAAPFLSFHICEIVNGVWMPPVTSDPLRAVGSNPSAGAEWSRRLRRRMEKQPAGSVTDPDLALLPAAPRRTIVRSHCGFVAELEWRRSDGLAAAEFLSTWLSQDWLRSTPLPVILTVEWSPPTWVPLIIVMLDEAMRDCGHGAQLGAFAARRLEHRDVVERFTGDLVGTFKENSKAYEDAVGRMLRRAEHSYLYQVPGPRADLVSIYDGSTGRAGGIKNANTAHGLYVDGCPLVNTVDIDDEADVIVSRKGCEFSGDFARDFSSAGWQCRSPHRD